MTKSRTVIEVRLMHAIGVARSPRKRLPRQIFPRPIEREYAKALLRYVDRVRAAFAPMLAELPSIFASALDERRDGTEILLTDRRLDAGEWERIKAFLARATGAIAVDTAEAEAIAIEFGRRVSSYQRVQMLRATRAALGTEVLLTDRRLDAVLNGFAAENVTLIKDIPAKLASDIEKSVTRALARATPHRELATELSEKFGFAENRAKLIARDQVGKLYGQVNGIRQQNLGVEKYIWRTAGDRRVRPEHESREGEVFSWDDAPSDGHPGEPILCRCYPEPVFDEILEDIEA